MYMYTSASDTDYLPEKKRHIRKNTLPTQNQEICNRFCFDLCETSS